MCVTALIAVGAASIGGTAYSIDRQRAAERAQERAAKIEKRRVAIQNARERRRASAQAQIQRSQIAAQSAAQGFSSSGSQQATAAINSQLAGNLSFNEQLSRMNIASINQQQSAQSALTQASYGQAIASLPSSLGMGMGSLIQGNIASGKTWWGGTPGPSTQGSSLFSQGVSMPSNMGSIPFTA